MEAGIFIDYLNISQTSTNNFGLGGRFGYRVHRQVMLEGELAYDYGINFNEAYRNITNGNIAAIERTSIGVTHGLVGPALEPAIRQVSSIRHVESWVYGFPPQSKPASGE